MLKASQGRMADVHGTTATRTASRHCNRLFQASDDPKQDRRAARPAAPPWLKLPPKILLFATVRDCSAPRLSLLSRGYRAISRAPRAAGYRGSDFVRWHGPPVRGAATIPSASEARLPSRDIAAVPQPASPGPLTSMQALLLL